MPVYDYKCKTCENEFEVFQHIKDDKHTVYECPVCKSEQPVVRLITSMNFVLIGRGWASDGYVDTYAQTESQI